MWYYLPNLITFTRILLIPVYIYFFIMGNYYLAFIFFILSAFTDFLDGYLARRFNLITELGKILDPLADKLTVISILFTLVFTGIIPKYIAIILLSREIFILFASTFVYFMGFDISPSLLGKTSIFLLYIAIAVSLLDINYVKIVLFYIVIPLNIFSGFKYIIDTLEKVRKSN